MEKAKPPAEEPTKEEIENELQTLDFNELERKARAYVTGRQEEWRYKTEIDNAIWRLTWWYGVGKHKNMRYGYGERFGKFPEPEQRTVGELYPVFRSDVEFRVPSR